MMVTMVDVARRRPWQRTYARTIRAALRSLHVPHLHVALHAVDVIDDADVVRALVGALPAEGDGAVELASRLHGLRLVEIEDRLFPVGGRRGRRSGELRTRAARGAATVR